MIRGIHGLLYSSDAAASRSFFRDLVQLPGSDVGGGWWIFDFPEGDLGIHPAEDPGDVGLHDVSIYCDDIHGTVTDLRSRGVEFLAPVEDHGYGLVTHFQAPGGIKVQLYEPRYVKGPTHAAAATPAKRKVAPKALKAGAKKGASKGPNKGPKKGAKKAAKPKAKRARRAPVRSRAR